MRDGGFRHRTARRFALNALLTDDPDLDRLTAMLEQADFGVDRAA